MDQSELRTRWNRRVGVAVERPFTPFRSALVRLALVRSAVVRSATLRSAWIRLASVRSAAVRIV